MCGQAWDICLFCSRHSHLRQAGPLDIWPQAKTSPKSIKFVISAAAIILTTSSSRLLNEYLIDFVTASATMDATAKAGTPADDTNPQFDAFLKQLAGLTMQVDATTGRVKVTQRPRQTSHNLMTLPTEIKLQIYPHIFRGKKLMAFGDRNFVWSKNMPRYVSRVLSILLVCRQANEEAKFLLYPLVTLKVIGIDLRQIWMTYDTVMPSGRRINFPCRISRPLRLTIKSLIIQNFPYPNVMELLNELPNLSHLQIYSHITFRGWRGLKESMLSRTHPLGACIEKAAKGHADYDDFIKSDRLRVDLLSFLAPGIPKSLLETDKKHTLPALSVRVKASDIL
jgi:hypothetical protein